jgi:hypothetical protein
MAEDVVASGAAAALLPLFVDLKPGGGHLAFDTRRCDRSAERNGWCTGCA